MPEESDSRFRIAAKLTLDEPRNIYYSGQVLKGCIECELTQPLTYSVINVNFTGEANVFWTESEVEEYNGDRRYVNVGYKSHETYFNTMICISGGIGVITLPPGSHKIPFQFQIPHTAPSSFSGDRGSVSYKVTAYIEYPDPSRNRDQLEQQYEVVAPLDLNIGEDIKIPIDLEFEEFFSCCCSSSPMTIRIHIPASGFCPGQAIPITIGAENQSNVEVKKITFELIKKECYHSKQPKSDYIPPEEVLQCLKTGPILANTKRDITYEMIVPSFIAPNLQNCNIIDVGYFIKVTIKLSGCNDDLKDENEICLGLVPLASEVDNYKHPMQSDLPQAAIPDPNYILAPPIQNIPHQTNAMQNSAAYTTASPYPSYGGPSPFPNATPYPPNATPYPSNDTPYQPNASPYPSNDTPYQPNASPYPSNDTPYQPNVSPYPTNPSPFPTQATPYPPDNANHLQSGIPMGNLRTGRIGFVSLPGANRSPHPGQGPPYPGSHPTYTGANPSNPGTNPSNPGTNPPYPVSNLPYPGENSANSEANSPYARANPPYPGANPPYLGANSPYPGANPPYPGANPPYPGENPPYPGANPPYPGENPPYPGANPPYPTTDAPYATNQPAKAFQPPYPVHSAPSAPPS